MELNLDEMRERLVTRGPFEEVTFQGRGKRPLGVRENGMFWEQTADRQHTVSTGAQDEGEWCETSLRNRQDEAPAGLCRPE